jgi:hypothetical protein
MTMAVTMLATPAVTRLTAATAFVIMGVTCSIARHSDADAAGINE